MANIVSFRLYRDLYGTDLDSLKLVMIFSAVKWVHPQNSLRWILLSPHSIKSKLVLESCWISLSLSNINSSITSPTVYYRQSNQYDTVSVGICLCTCQGGYYLCFYGWDNKFDCQFGPHHAQEWYMKPMIQYLLTVFLVVNI